MLPRLLALLSFLLAGATPASVQAVAAAPLLDTASALDAALSTGPARLPGMTVDGEWAKLQAVYAAHRSGLLWSNDGRLTDQANQLVDVLASVEADGLRPSDYAAEVLAAQRSRLASGPAYPSEDWVNFDILLSRAAIRLLTHLHYGCIDPRQAGYELNLPRSDLDVPAAVAALASAMDVGEAVGRAEPRFHHYGLLKAALARYRALQADPTLTQLPDPGRRPVHPGEAYAGAPALRKLLAALGDLPQADADADPQNPTLDAGLVRALMGFQRAHGLSPDGALGAETFAALTTPLALRVRQIELTLERWRWLPPFERPPIVVNIPQFKLFAFKSTADRADAIISMNVIVGQVYPRTRTPVFIGNMTHVIFRPFWDIPRDIMLREMLPLIGARADYLERNHLEIVDGESDSSPVLEPSADALAALAAGRARLRQRPGEDNALGLIKFIFPNAYNVYLHSTPAHRLFLQPRRAFSHGCIRISDPVGLALYVLRNEPEVWDEEHIDAAMHGADSTRIELHSPIPVMILYGTVQATEAGPVEFYADIYGHDLKLQRLLERRRRDGAAR